MKITHATYDGFYKHACLFEASLVLVAVLLGWLVNINPFKHLYISEIDIFYGIVGTVPLFLMFLAMQKMQMESVTDIRSFLLKTLAANLHSYNWLDLFVLAAIAGISEELLFRGVIQPWIETSWGGWGGLVASNILFGLVHAITPLYALLAMLVGIYLGLAMDYGDNRSLLTPIMIHVLYDFLAFMALMRVYRTNLSTPF